MNFRLSCRPAFCGLGLLHYIVLSLALAMPALSQAQAAMLLPTTALEIGKHTVQAEVAATDASRARGLMFRTQLPKNHGMIFVYPYDTMGCFWMKNTPLPLSIAFLDNQGVILNILDMTPLTLDNYCPVAPMRYALEMEQGWFRQAGIRAGDTVRGLPASN